MHSGRAAQRRSIGSPVSDRLSQGGSGHEDEADRSAEEDKRPSVGGRPRRRGGASCRDRQREVLRVERKRKKTKWKVDTSERQRSVATIEIQQKKRAKNKMGLGERTKRRYFLQNNKRNSGRAFREQLIIVVISTLLIQIQGNLCSRGAGERVARGHRTEGSHEAPVMALVGEEPSRPGNNSLAGRSQIVTEQPALVANQQLQELNFSLTSSDDGNSTMNGNNTSGQPQEEDDRALIWGIITANSIIFVIGLCGNAIVILVILRFTRIETVTDIYILNLAFADLMFILGLVFLITTMFIDHWIFGNLMCKLYMATTSLNQFASSLLLVVMSFDRFLAVCHPIYAQRFRRLRRAKIICLCIWITCLILMTPIFAFARTNKDLTCAIFWPDYKSFNCEIAFTLYSFGIGFALPLLLIAAFYICVIRKLRIAASGPLNLGSTRRSRTRENTNKRIEHLVIGIICTYTVCWLPYWITQLCVSFTTHLEHTPIQGFYSFFLIATSLSYTNSALNPILYAFLSDNFKRRCSDVFRSIYSISWCRPSQCTESHSTVTSACYESEISRPESRQTVLLNESVRLTGAPNQNNSESVINNNCGNRQIDVTDGLVALARSTLDPLGDHEHFYGNNSNNSNANQVEINPDGSNTEDDFVRSTNSRPHQADPRKKSVNFSVDTFVVQGLNNETVKGNHKILQMDKSRSHDV